MRERPSCENAVRVKQDHPQERGRDESQKNYLHNQPRQLRAGFDSTKIYTGKFSNTIAITKSKIMKESMP